MNKIKQQQEKRKILNMIGFASRTGNKENCFQAYMSETENHIRMKFEVWLKLRKNKYSVWCEPIFNNGIRMDILAFRDGIFINYEILVSEKDKQLANKTKNYPSEITIIPIRNEKDIKELEML